MNNLFAQSHSHWVRYDRYEIKTGKDGKRYITPENTAKPDVYNPLKESSEMVLEALNVGMLMMNRSPEDEVEKAILAFVTHYGLLGLMTALPTTPSFMDYEAVYLPKNHFIKEESMATEDYLALFYPFDKLDVVKKGVESSWNVLLIIGCSLYAVWYFKQRSNYKHRRQMEKFEQEKEREIYHAKIDFFTNVAHEIRTPLTLIKGPLENIILKKKVDAETREDLNIMKQNTERLLNLTNQLLDFRKTESQGFRLNFAKCNITEVLKETHLRFTSLAKQKGLEFTLQLPETDFYAHVNQEAFTKIISNLLNNAVKYSEHYIHVSLEVTEGDESNVFRIRTVNDGVIIPREMREEIFQPFVRFNEREDGKVTTGTGIGLALSRSLAELHQGTLAMGEEENSNTFCLTLPIVQDMTITLTPETKAEPEPVSEVPVEVEQGEKKDNRPTVLVVEDNPDMRAFVVRQLSKEYAVLSAVNGAEALKMLDGNYVNLVVSDVVMPVMDGFELCKTIKSDLNYSHIPVILLTAKTNIQSKIEGMELGADAYIEKPFSVEYLQACASNLIQNREKLRRTFAQSPFVAANTMALTKADEDFIKRLNEVILANLNNPEFSMDDIADSLNMSRSNFYRKIKGVLDLSPNEYLRLERLKKAAQLLKEGEGRVTEICYMVGFNSPSYFAKCFQKQFGVLPKDFVD